MVRDALLKKAEAQISSSDLARYAAELSERKRDPYTLVEEIVCKAAGPIAENS